MSSPKRKGGSMGGSGSESDDESESSSVSEQRHGQRRVRKRNADVTHLTSVPEQQEARSTAGASIEEIEGLRIDL